MRDGERPEPAGKRQEEADKIRATSQAALGEAERSFAAAKTT